MYQKSFRLPTSMTQSLDQSVMIANAMTHLGEADNTTAGLSLETKRTPPLPMLEQNHPPPSHQHMLRAAVTLLETVVSNTGAEGGTGQLPHPIQIDIETANAAVRGSTKPSPELGTTGTRGNRGTGADAGTSTELAFMPPASQTPPMTQRDQDQTPRTAPTEITHTTSTASTATTATTTALSATATAAPEISKTSGTSRPGGGSATKKQHQNQHQHQSEFNAQQQEWELAQARLRARTNAQANGRVLAQVWAQSEANTQAKARTLAQVGDCFWKSGFVVR
jgi:hypothetical protein